MFSLTAGNQTRFVGLRDEVLYRIELGFAVVDDGDRLFRIEQRLFELIIDDEVAPNEIAEPERSVVEGHPSVFALFDDAESAMRSVQSKEL